MWVKVPRLGEVLSSESGDGEGVQEGRPPQHQTQMKLFTAIATAVVLGGSLIATTISASAQTTYRVTPRYGGGYKVRGSNGYSGTYRPRYGGGGTYTFY